MYAGKTALIILTAAMLSGCPSSSDDGDDVDDMMSGSADDPDSGPNAGNGSSTGNGTVIMDPNPDNGTTAITQFDGDYLTPCRADPDEVGVWAISEFSIQTGTFNLLQTEYSDSACTEITGRGESIASITFPGSTTNTSLGLATFVDLTIESAIFNGVANPAAVGLSFFDLFLLDGDTIYSGLTTDSLDSSTPEARPTEIDVNDPAFRRLPSDNSNVANPGTVTSNTSRFNGNYASGCLQQQADDGSAFGLIVGTSIQADRYTLSFFGFSNAGCTGEPVTASVDYAIEYPGGTANTSLGVADFINLTELTSTNIDGVTEQLDGVIEYDLLLLDGNTLYRGQNTATLDGTSPERRPIDAEVSLPSTRL